MTRSVELTHSDRHQLREEGTLPGPSRESLAPVAGIPILHELEPGIVFGPAPDWAGSVQLDDPVRVRHTVRRPDRARLHRLFDASPSCSYYTSDEGVVVEFRGPARGVPDQLLLARRPGYDYELAYAECPAMPMYQRAKDRTILSMALAERQRGFVVHACGFLLDGVGMLFPGLPSAGKSTLAGLLAKVAVPLTLLSDDRIALTSESEGFRIWGTPWPGDARVIGPHDGPLGAIVMLRHGSGASLRSMAPGTAARRLMETLVLPLWNRSLLPGSLSFVSRLVNSVALYEFTYEPTVPAVTAMLEMLAGRGRGV